MKQQLADTATNKSETLNGFKVLGVFPFHLSHITVRTHIQLCGIKEKLSTIQGEKTPDINDFFDHSKQKKITPIIKEYIATGLLNNRSFGWLFKFFIKLKLNNCTHSQILGLYGKLNELGQPAFFLTYWKVMVLQDHTLLKEEKL